MFPSKCFTVLHYFALLLFISILKTFSCHWKYFKCVFNCSSFGLLNMCEESIVCWYFFIGGKYEGTLHIVWFLDHLHCIIMLNLYKEKYYYTCIGYKVHNKNGNHEPTTQSQNQSLIKITRICVHSLSHCLCFLWKR